MHREPRHPGRSKWSVAMNQRGMALVIVLIVIVALTALGTAGYMLSATRHGRVVTVKKNVAGLAAADGGVEEARQQLNDDRPVYLDDPSATPSTSWGVYIKPPSGTTVMSGSTIAEAVDPSFEAGYTQVASLQSHSKFHWVRIRHKTENDAITGEYVDGDPATSGQIVYYGYYGAVTYPTQFTLGALTTVSTDHKPIKVAVSYGTEKAGVIAELAYNPGVFIPGGLYAKGPVTNNGAASHADGSDEAVPPEPALPPVVTGTGFTENAPPGQDMTTDPDPPGVIEPPAPVPDIDIDALVEMLKYDARVLIDAPPDDGAAIIQTSTAADSETFYIEQTGGPNISYNNLTGYGILLVEGNLDIGGGFNWYGVILVTGDLTFSGGGGPNQINIHGSALAGGSCTLNGNVDFRYHSGWTKDVPFRGSPNIIKWKEV